MYEVRVRGLRFRGRHGVLERERRQGNDFSASIVATVDGTADATDNLADTVDYAALAGILVATSDSQSFQTVEALAGAVASCALEALPKIRSISVCIDKLSPPMDAQVDSCGVRLVRDR